MGGYKPAGAWLLPGLLFLFLRSAVMSAPYVLRSLPDAPPHHNFISPHSARSNHAAGFSAPLGLHCRSPPPWI